ncbi:unnamed protein product [Gordionus sp. m RMFG-2023]
MNSSNMELPNCSDFVYKPLTYFSMIIYVKVSSLIVIIGVIGNGLGLIVSCIDSNYSYKVNGKSYERVKRADNVLVKSFFIVNIINCSLMILWPIIDSYASYYEKNIWLTKAWHMYIIHYHVPLFKTFLVFSFLISVLFAVDHFFAITWPFKYKIYCNAKTAKWAVAICFFYTLIWCAPLTLWYHITVVRCLQKRDKFDSPRYIPDELHIREIFIPKDVLKRDMWTIYQILREFTGKIIPFCVVIVLHCFVIKKRRKIVNRIESVRLENSDVPNTKCNVSERKKSVVNLQIRSNVVFHSDYNHVSRNEGNLRENLTILEKRKEEINRNLKTIILFMIQFMLFLLPSSIYHIIAIAKRHSLSWEVLSITWSISYFLEYLFVSLTFYINLLFNKGYRKYVFDIIKPYVSNIKMKLGNLSIIFKKK